MQPGPPPAITPRDRSLWVGFSRLLRQLGRQLIEIEVLATELHPDKPGGSSEAMARLSRVRGLLRAAL